VLADLAGRCDLVLIDAPCTGTGVWRRHPDAKWRLAPGALAQRIAEQSALLVSATRFVKPGGRIAYVTCSLLIDENERQIADFLAAHPEFAAIPAEAAAAAAGLPELGRFASPHGAGFRFSPAQGGADGFYVALLQKSGPIP
jgi:16S rRNA (cytosine967-C5)-methyltransferase